MTVPRCGIVLTLAFIGLFLLICGCGKPNIPLYAAPNLAKIGFDTITLLPVVDRRVDRSHDFDPEEAIGNKVEKRLKKKGYTVIRPGAFSDDKVISNDEVVEMEIHEMSVLGSSDTEYMMLVYLDDVSSKTGLGYTFKIELTATLVGKEKGALLWKDKAVESQGQGGAMGCLMSGAVKGEVLNKAANEATGSLPNAPAKRKG